MSDTDALIAQLSDRLSRPTTPEALAARGSWRRFRQRHIALLATFFGARADIAHRSMRAKFVIRWSGAG